MRLNKHFLTSDVSLREFHTANDYNLENIIGITWPELVAHYHIYIYYVRTLGLCGDIFPYNPLVSLIAALKYPQLLENVLRF